MITQYKYLYNDFTQNEHAVGLAGDGRMIATLILKARYSLYAGPTEEEDNIGLNKINKNIVITILYSITTF